MNYKICGCCGKETDDLYSVKLRAIFALWCKECKDGKEYDNDYKANQDRGE